MSETRERKQSALKTMLDLMDVPDMRKDTTSASNIRWLGRNLGVQNSAHPLFATAMGLVRWLQRAS